LDALLFAIDVSEFDGENTNTLTTNIIGDTGFHWIGGIAIRQVESVELEAGDADQDYDFDQLDLVKVQIAGKYLSGLPATWGEGDWNGAPGGSAGNPPPGDGQFNQLDIVAAQQAGIYLTGPYIEPAAAGDTAVAIPETSALLSAALAFSSLLQLAWRRRKRGSPQLA
jgi:hypothetical protein